MVKIRIIREIIKELIETKSPRVQSVELYIRFRGLPLPGRNRF